MKKFKFLVFMLILTSIFIGCAEPTDDLVIPKTATEAEPTDNELFEAAQIKNNGEILPALFNEKFTIHKREFTVSNYSIEDVNGQYTIKIEPFASSIISINITANNTTLTYDELIISNIRRIYTELPSE